MGSILPLRLPKKTTQKEVDFIKVRIQKKLYIIINYHYESVFGFVFGFGYF